MSDEETKADRQPVVILGGPTASGKSALAAAIARAFDGTVINADSMQVYRELPVLTAQPSAAERAAVPHRLYGFLPVTERCSAARWAALARSEIEAAHDSGRLPIVVGGSGLYLKALVEGLAPVPEIPADVREAARRRLAEIGKAAFHAELAQRDPQMAARLRPGDSQRMVRAWEVMAATGRSLAAWQAQSVRPPDGAARFAKFLLLPERSLLYAACDARFAAMVARGALEEARQVAALADDPGLPGLKALGLRELIRHVRGDVTLGAAIAAGQQATRRYAKRQITWFRHQFDGAWQIGAEMSIGQFSESFLAGIYNFIRISC
ncbi:MAG TPA: tRNA (adenosine(37)-N6)-dimethylallyltransferase MiaA [Dongiaceae bacterium]